MLIKRRAIHSFYCYLKYTVSPTIDTYYREGGLVSKYAAKYPLIMSFHQDEKQRHPMLDLESAVKDLLEKEIVY